MKKVFLDTETCGLVGMPVLIQYAYEDEPVTLYNIWKNPISDTLELIEKFCQSIVIGFNLAFDWFQLTKVYNVLALYHDYSEYPEDIIRELAALEKAARDGPCLKPYSALDLMLVARKGKYQSVMHRSPIYIRKVPVQIVDDLIKVLDEQIKLADIYFSKRDSRERWKIRDTDDPNFKNIVLDFAASGSLKAIVADAFGIEADTILKFYDIEVPRIHYPEEKPYAPFGGTWPEKIRHHINHWEFNQLAREYAEKDVIYTRDLYKFFGEPEHGDDDSVLSCMVASVRWKGFAINIDRMIEENLKEKAKSRKITAPEPCLKYLHEVLDDFEKSVVTSTDKVTLNKLASWDHPVAERAKEIIENRSAAYLINFYEKLIHAERFHADFSVIGTLSSRMGGGGSTKGIESDKGNGLNPQGIRKNKNIRSLFPLAFDGEVLCGGDFVAYEVSLAEAVYNDPELRKELLTCEECESKMESFRCVNCGSNKGKKIHALFGMSLFPGMSYHEIKASDEKYTKAKIGMFSMLYGGTEHSLMTQLGVDRETALEALARFHKRYPGVKRAQMRVTNAFCTMTQKGGVGSRIVWAEPADYIESMLGFRRYFTLENKICKGLFDLASNPPKEWRNLKINVIRRDRVQTGFGATQSALYGAAFAIQASNTRAANNHLIQSTGATITKRLQRKIWDVQPVGVHKFLVRPMNIHDEIMCPTAPEVVDKVSQIVEETVAEYRKIIPLLNIDWKTNLETWADK
jgi:hypothetical protein